MMTATEIEAIVRSVLQRTLDSDIASVLTMEKSANAAIIDSNLVTLASLPSKLDGIAELHIATHAVVTPSVVDLLRGKKIRIVRGKQQPKPDLGPKGEKSDKPTSAELSSPTMQRLLIVGNAPWISGLKAPLCPKQTKLVETTADDSSNLRLIAEGLRHGHQAAVLIASAVHASCWQAARDDRLRPVVVHDWSEGREILNEVPTNLMILCRRRWNAPATANLVRTFVEHLKKT